MSVKKNSISLKRKLEILQEIDCGTSYSKIAENFNIPKGSIHGILKNRLKYESSSAASTSKRLKKGKFPEVEDALLEWLKFQRSKLTPISGPILREKAAQLAKLLNVNDFKISDGWLEGFKKRHGIVFRSIAGEKTNVNEGDIHVWLEVTLPNLIRDYKLDDVFNLDETGLFYRLLPEKTLTFKGDSCQGGKKSKERLTVLLGANMTGTEKIEPLVVGKFARPRCLKNIYTLPVYYKFNSKAWMTSTLWEQFLREYDKKFLQQKRNVLFIVDNCPAHPEIDKLHSIKVVYLPPNTTSITQPMDMGIIQNFKICYRKLLLSEMITAIDNHASYEINLLKAFFLIKKAWQFVSSETIANCFRKAGFLNEPIFVDINEEDSDSSSVENLWSNFAARKPLNSSIKLNDFLYIDDCVTTKGDVTDIDIVEHVLLKRNGLDVEDDDNDDSEEIVIPPITDIGAAFDIIKRYLIAQQKAENALNSLLQVENNISRFEINKRKQCKITRFFASSSQ